MSTETNKAIVRRYQEAINAADWDALDDVLTDDVATPLMMPGYPPGREGAKAIGQATLAAWLPHPHRGAARRGRPGRRADHVHRNRGQPRLRTTRHREAFTMSGVYVVRIADGRIVEHSGVEDALGMLGQIGVM